MTSVSLKKKRALTRILSIDGGGIRGIIPGQVLVALEKKLQAHDPNARLAHYFDLMVGTSTGGILVCAYLCPDPTDGKRPKFSADQAVDLYVERGHEVFDITLAHRIRTAGGTLDEKHPAASLEKALKSYFGDTKLNELLQPCLITAYDVSRRRAHFFTQHDTKGDAQNFFVRDVARATSAAPTFFETAQVYSMSGVPYPLIDGGVFANNPALCGYAEARAHQQLGKPTASQMAILSLGTGEVKRPYPYKECKDWGLIGWARPVIDIMMSGVAETVDYQLRQMFDAVKATNQYVRIQPELPPEVDEAMDNASRENIRALVEFGKQVAEDHDRELNEFMERMLPPA